MKPHWIAWTPSTSQYNVQWNPSILALQLTLLHFLPWSSINCMAVFGSRSTVIRRPLLQESAVWSRHLAGKKTWGLRRLQCMRRYSCFDLGDFIQETHIQYQSEKLQSSECLWLMTHRLFELVLSSDTVLPEFHHLPTGGHGDRAFRFKEGNLTVSWSCCELAIARASGGSTCDTCDQIWKNDEQWPELCQWEFGWVPRQGFTWLIS